VQNAAKTTHGPVNRRFLWSPMLLCSFGLILLCSSIVAVAVDLPRTAELLPSETVLLIDIPDFTQLAGQFKKTDFYKFYKDPAMAALLDDTKERIREQLKEMNSEFLSSIFDLGIVPAGRVAFAVILNEKTIDANDPPFVLIIQAGDRIGKLKEYAEKKVNEEIDGGARRETEDYRGVTVQTVIDGESAYSYCFVDDCFIITLPEILKFVVAHIKGASGATLADDPDYTPAIRAVGPHHDIDIYVNIKQLTKIMIAKDPAGRFKAIVANLGLDNLSSLGCALGLGRDLADGSSAKVILRIDGEKKGICKMLEFESAALQLPEFAPADFYSASFVNLDIQKAFDAISRIAQGFSPQAAALLLMPILPPSPDGQPGLALKADIIDHLGSQYMTLRSIDKSVSSTDRRASESLTALAANNRTSLDTSLSRLHALFSRNDPDARRQLLGHTIYTLDLAAFFPALMPAATPSAQVPGRPPSMPMSVIMPKIAFTVTDTHLILGAESVVERAVRTLSAAGQNTVPKWFARAKAVIPDAVGFAGLQNDVVLAEVFWETMNEMGGSEPETSDDESKRSIGISISPTTGLSFSQGGVDLIDAKLLPDFETVKKYFGLSVSYAVARPDGFFLEFKYINPD